MKLERFREALLELGNNDAERARALGCSVRTIVRLRAADLPEPTERLMQQPSLLRALAADAEAHQQRISETSARSTN
jgi:hypothetical protein